MTLCLNLAQTQFKHYFLLQLMSLNNRFKEIAKFNRTVWLVLSKPVDIYCGYAQKCYGVFMRHNVCTSWKLIRGHGCIIEWVCMLSPFPNQRSKIALSNFGQMVDVRRNMSIDWQYRNEPLAGYRMPRPRFLAPRCPPNKVVEMLPSKLQ